MSRIYSKDLALLITLNLVLGFTLSLSSAFKSHITLSLSVIYNIYFYGYVLKMLFIPILLLSIEYFVNSLLRKYHRTVSIACSLFISSFALYLVVIALQTLTHDAGTLAFRFFQSSSSVRDNMLIAILFSFAPQVAFVIVKGAQPRKAVFFVFGMFALCALSVPSKGDSWFDGNWYANHSYVNSMIPRSRVSTLTVLRFDGKYITMKVSTIERRDELSSRQDPIYRTNIIKMSVMRRDSRYVVASQGNDNIYDMRLSMNAQQITLSKRGTSTVISLDRSGAIRE